MTCIGPDPGAIRRAQRLHQACERLTRVSQAFGALSDGGFQAVGQLEEQKDKGLFLLSE